MRDRWRVAQTKNSALALETVKARERETHTHTERGRATEIKTDSHPWYTASQACCAVQN